MAPARDTLEDARPPRRPRYARAAARLDARTIIREALNERNVA